MDKSCLALPQISHCKIPRGINMAAQVTTEGGRSRDRQRERGGQDKHRKIQRRSLSQYLQVNMQWHSSNNEFTHYPKECKIC